MIAVLDISRTRTKVILYQHTTSCIIVLTIFYDRINFLPTIICSTLNREFMSDQLYKNLKPYLLTPAPDFACMLDGQWGSGKTYFVKKYLKEQIAKEEDLKKLKIRYASANGIKEFDEMLEELKRQKILPTNNNKIQLIGKFAGKVIDKLPMKLIGNLIVPGSGEILEKATGDIKSEFGEDDIKLILEAISFGENDVIIIDDLERVHTDCDLISLIGEINTEFIEHRNIKTILVCDETELKNRFGEQRNDRKLKGIVEDYKNAKEKGIRYTYKFSPDLESIIESLIKGLNRNIYKPESKQFLLQPSHLSKIIEFIRQYKLKNKANWKPVSTFQNLRVIKQIIEIQARTLDLISTKNKPLIFERLLNFIIENILFIKYYDENEQSDLNIGTNYKGLFHKELDDNQRAVIDLIDQWINTKYNLFKPTSLFFESKSLRQYIFAGIFNDKQIKDDIENQISSLGLDRPEGKILNKFIFYNSLTDDEFNSAWEDVIKTLQNNDFNFSHSISLLTTLCSLVNRNFNTLVGFSSHKEISIYFTQYLSQNEADSITDFASIDQFKKELQKITEPEYNNLKTMLFKILKNRELALNESGFKAELKMVVDGNKKLDNRLLLKLISNGDKDDYQVFFSHYVANRQCKIDFYHVVLKPYPPYNENEKSWITSFLSEALDKLDVSSINRLTVIDTIQEFV